MALAAHWGTERLSRSFSSAARSQKTLEQLRAVEAHLESAESAALRFVVTGDAGKLRPYQTARSQAPRLLQSIESEATDAQKKTLKRLKRLYLNHLAYLGDVVTVRAEQGAETASRLVAASDYTSHRQSLDRLLGDLRAIESSRSASRTAFSFREAWRTKIALLLLAGAGLGCLVWAFMLLGRATEERRVAEQDRGRLETFLRSIIERIPYMIIVKEATWLRTTLVNKAAARFWGRTEEELLGGNALDLWPKARAQEAMARDREALRSGRPMDFPEETVTRQDGVDRILHVQKVTVPDANGDPAFLVTIAEDITERKEAERLLALSRDTALESARLKSEFLRNMSHEVRTPLSVVIGMLTLLADADTPKQSRPLIAKAAAAANALARLAKDLLDLTRMETGTLTLESRNFPLRRSIEESLRMLEEQARAKGIALEVSLSPELPEEVRGDEVRLRQVLMHLAGNAVKFTDRGTVRVAARLDRQDGARLWTNIQISDTGPGIAPDAQKHLFEPFRQGDGSPTRRFGGTGLGLAVSRRMVELLGGAIGFESEAGKGSSFWFTLPYEKADASREPGEVVALPWVRARVLVVAENEIARRHLRQKLSTWSVASDEAPGGGAACDILQRERKAGRAIPVVISEWHLPDMDASELVRKIRRDPTSKGTSVLLIAPDADMFDAEAVRALGFSACLTPPVEPQALFEALSRFIDPAVLKSPHAA